MGAAHIRDGTHMFEGARIAQFVKSPDLQSIDGRFGSHCWWGVLLASLSLQIAKVA